MQRLFFLCLFGATLFTYSCGNDDDGVPNNPDCTSAAFNLAINNSVQELNVAAQNFANDPTTANCEAYRQAASNYIDAVDDFENCAVINQAEYQAAIDAARASLDMIQC
ncbi:MAG: hypothetical protein AAFQ37_10290 [Bacteroidota bacterium]